MSNFENPFKDFVFSLPEDKLDLLIECINNRKDYNLYGVTNLEDATGENRYVLSAHVKTILKMVILQLTTNVLNVRIVGVLIHYYRIPCSIQVRCLFIRY